MNSINDCLADLRYLLERFTELGGQELALDVLRQQAERDHNLARVVEQLVAWQHRKRPFTFWFAEGWVEARLVEVDDHSNPVPLCIWLEAQYASGPSWRHNALVMRRRFDRVQNSQGMWAYCEGQEGLERSLKAWCAPLPLDREDIHAAVRGVLESATLVNVLEPRDAFEGRRAVGLLAAGEVYSLPEDCEFVHTLQRQPLFS